MFKKIFTLLTVLLALTAVTAGTLAEKSLPPAPGEMTEAQAIERAKAFLAGLDAPGLDQAKAETLLDEDTENFYDDYGTQISFEGRRTWSVVLRPGIRGLPYGGSSHVSFLSTGEILDYSVPAMDYMFLTGLLPEEGAVPEAQAAETGRKAIAEKLDMAESEVTDVRAYFGEINLDDPQVTGGRVHQKVWGVDCGLDIYALLTPTGEVIDVKAKPVFITE